MQILHPKRNGAVAGRKGEVRGRTCWHKSGRGKGCKQVVLGFDLIPVQGNPLKCCEADFWRQSVQVGENGFEEELLVGENFYSQLLCQLR